MKGLVLYLYIYVVACVIFFITAFLYTVCGSEYHKIKLYNEKTLVE